MKTNTPVYIALGITSAAYAEALNTDTGKEFADEYTWASVVAGTGLVLTILRFIIPREYWQKVVLAFVVAGIPMIARSLLNRAKMKEE
ncbi:MAG: hypothetical protein GY869_15230 [Planctomycetes bacterium]|nr:hypothetical protein [Planctomycetota bacterium]